MGASITGYGLPLAWLEKVTIVYPGSPEEYSLHNSGIDLLADIAFWTIIVAVIYFVYTRLKNSAKTSNL